MGEVAASSCCQVSAYGERTATHPFSATAPIPDEDQPKLMIGRVGYLIILCTAPVSTFQICDCLSSPAAISKRASGDQARHLSQSTCSLSGKSDFTSVKAFPSQIRIIPSDPTEAK